MLSKIKKVTATYIFTALGIIFFVGFSLQAILNHHLPKSGMGINHLNTLHTYLSFFLYIVIPILFGITLKNIYPVHFSKLKRYLIYLTPLPHISLIGNKILRALTYVLSVFLSGTILFFVYLLITFDYAFADNDLVFFGPSADSIIIYLLGATIILLILIYILKNNYSFLEGLIKIILLPLLILTILFGGYYMRNSLRYIYVKNIICPQEASASEKSSFTVNKKFLRCEM